MTVSMLKPKAEVGDNWVNESGVFPVEFKVLILPEDVEDADPILRRAKAAGLKLAEDYKEREQMANVHGTLVAVGGNAFQDWREPIPKVGQRALFAKYAGNQVHGADGRLYRIASDKDLAAVLE